MRRNLPLAAKLTVHEKRWRERNWRRFGMTVPGRMSWADWFYMVQRKRDEVRPN